MSEHEPTLEEVMQEIFDSERANLHTSLPGRIESYNPVTQTANVALMIQHVENDENGNPVKSKYPVLANVPVAFPRGGGYFLHFPLTKGDFCFVIFCEAAIDQWRAKGAETYPGDLRRHGLTGAVALPCLYPRTRIVPLVDPTGVILGEEAGTVVQVTPTEVRLGDVTAVDPVALQTKVFAAISAMLAAGVGATGTDAFAAALTAWTGAIALSNPMGALKVKGI